MKRWLVALMLLAAPAAGGQYRLPPLFPRDGVSLAFENDRVVARPHERVQVSMFPFWSADGRSLVRFTYRQPYADGSTPFQYGLIAAKWPRCCPGLLPMAATGSPKR